MSGNFLLAHFTSNVLKLRLVLSRLFNDKVSNSKVPSILQALKELHARENKVKYNIMGIFLLSWKFSKSLKAVKGPRIKKFSSIQKKRVKCNPTELAGSGNPIQPPSLQQSR